MKARTTISLLFIMQVCFSAKATLITETWKTTVTHGLVHLFDGGYLKRSQDIYWYVEFDDEVGFYDFWLDGVNRKGEFGFGDDTLLRQHRGRGFSNMSIDL